MSLAKPVQRGGQRVQAALAEHQWTLPGQRAVAECIAVIEVLRTADVLVYKASGGRLMNRFPGGFPICIVATRGAKTGRRREIALIHLPHGGDKLLVSIFDPNREVAPNFTAWTVETTDGETVTGLLVRETDSAVTLKLAGGAEAVFARAQVTAMRQETRSLMPEGLEAGLSPADVAGLLAWLTGRPGGTPP